MRCLLLLGLLLAFGFVPSARAQTVRDLANRGACSTAGLEGISAQLAEAQMCLRPGAFVRFAPAPGITLSSSRIHPFLQATARDALHRAAARTPITVNSAFRTLADQYVLYHSGGCGLAARPGQSNHQTGRAVDVADYSRVRSALEGAGCAWLGSSDPAPTWKLAQVAIDAGAAAGRGAQGDTPRSPALRVLRRSLLAHDTRCPNCGARVGA
ncbi:MAG: M15 family metallopeptidase [Polyangiales bacterium]